MVEISVVPAARRATRTLERLLSRFGRVAAVTGDRYQSEGAPDFLLLDAPLERFAAKKGILVVWDGAFRLPELDEGASVLLCGGTGDALHFDGQAISCGMGARDTVTVSSLTPDSAVISVQRPISTLSGNSYLPTDIPVSFEGGVEAESLMAAACVLILCDRMPESLCFGPLKS